MSSILKALKKLEEQKAPRPKYEVDLSSGIMRERKPGSKRRWTIPAAMVAIALAAAMTTYTIMAVQNSTAKKERNAAQPIAPLPHPVNQASESQFSPAVSPPAPVPGPVSGLKPASVPAGIPAVNRDAPRSKPSQKQAEATDETKRSLPAVRATAVKPSVLPPSIPPERQDSALPRVPTLKLTGIAWEKDSASRYAVVNGVAVRQGSTVEGAKIEEILPDKVRFSQGARAFEISLGSVPAIN